MARLATILAFFLVIGCGPDEEPTVVVGPGGGTPGQGAGGAGGGNSSGTEDCNGQDDDNDGQVDEGLVTSPCSTACGEGIAVCQDGSWTGCDAPAVVEEFCDGVDNDCDGQTDEELSRACSTACGDGLEYCQDGDWAACDAPAVAAEACDNVDNDCDGNLDEGVFRECETSCGSGSEQCLGGVWGDCEAVILSDEICENGFDEDCDDRIDEGCGCAEGDTKACSENIGSCSRGTRTCDGSGDWGPCLDDEGNPVRSPGEVAEDCNGIDDDCNGRVDDIMMGAECGLDEGVCQLGRLSCEGGVRACIGGTEPSEERCDELDNDCDGNVDEEVVGVIETCDGIDNDCDMSIDEAVAPDQWAPNQACGEAANLGEGNPDGDCRTANEQARPAVCDRQALPQPGGGDAPIDRVRNGVLSGGESDWFTLMVDEATKVCEPVLGTGTRDYRTTVALIDFDEDTTFELCATFDRNGDSANCQVAESCVRSDQNQPMELSAVSNDRCLRTDDTRVTVRVRAIDAPACAPYGLRFVVENAN